MTGLRQQLEPFKRYVETTLREANKHYQSEGCLGCRQILQFARSELGIKMNFSRGERDLEGNVIQ